MWFSSSEIFLQGNPNWLVELSNVNQRASNGRSKTDLTDRFIIGELTSEINDKLNGPVEKLWFELRSILNEALLWRFIILRKLMSDVYQCYDEDIEVEELFDGSVSSIYKELKGN